MVKTETADIENQGIKNPTGNAAAVIRHDSTVHKGQSPMDLAPLESLCYHVLYGRLHHYRETHAADNIPFKG